MNDNVDYRAPAELYPAPSHRRGSLGYRRFNTLAEAVQYAVEGLPATELPGALIESEEIRYAGGEIAALYAAPGYPLQRRGFN